MRLQMEWGSDGEGSVDGYVAGDEASVRPLYPSYQCVRGTP